MPTPAKYDDDGNKIDEYDDDGNLVEPSAATSSPWNEQRFKGGAEIAGSLATDLTTGIVAMGASGVAGAIHGLAAVGAHLEQNRGFGFDDAVDKGYQAAETASEMLRPFSHYEPTSPEGKAGKAKLDAVVEKYFMKPTRDWAKGEIEGMSDLVAGTHYYNFGPQKPSGAVRLATTLLEQATQFMIMGGAAKLPGAIRLKMTDGVRLSPAEARVVESHIADIGDEAVAWDAHKEAGTMPALKTEPVEAKAAEKPTELQSNPDGSPKQSTVIEAPVPDAGNGPPKASSGYGETPDVWVKSPTELLKTGDPVTVEEKPAIVSDAVSELQIPGGKPLSVRYAVMEADDLIPSHNPNSFAKNPAYPAKMQERPYDTDRVEQSKVMMNAQNFEPSYVLTDNPDASTGPPVVGKGGEVYGGNGRTMAIQRLTDRQMEGYKAELMGKAGQFGLDPATVAGMTKPVLVRRLEAAPATLQEGRALVTDLNRGTTQSLNPTAEAVASGARISMGTKSWVSDKLEGLGDEASIPKLLSSPNHAFEIVRHLSQDGVIPATRLSEYITADGEKLTDKGKLFVENALLGSVINDGELIDGMAASVKNKIVKALAPLSRIALADGEWNALPKLHEAIKLVNEAGAEGMRTDKYIKTIEEQTSIFGKRDIDPQTAKFARYIDRATPNALKKMLADFAAEGARASSTQGELGGFLGKQRTAPESLDALFNVPTEVTTSKPLENMAVNASKRGTAKVKSTLADVAATPPKYRPLGEDVFDMAPPMEKIGFANAIYNGIMKKVNVRAVSPAHDAAANELVGIMGWRFHLLDVVKNASREAKDKWTREGVYSEKTPLLENPGVKFLIDYRRGNPIPPQFQKFADYMGGVMEQLAETVQREDPGSLQYLRRNYIKQQFLESPAEIQRVLDIVNDRRSAEDNTAAPESKGDKLFGGAAGFLKHAVFNDYEEAIKLGLHPISNNPADVFLRSVNEMTEHLLNKRMVAWAKKTGQTEVFAPGEIPRGNWHEIKDPRFSNVYGPPEVAVREYVDANMYNGLNGVASALGIKHERVSSLGGGDLGRATREGKNVAPLIQTRFATDLSVLAHEIGHQLDYKYNLWDRLVERAGDSERTAKAKAKAKWTAQTELNALSDLKIEGIDATDAFKKYTRKSAEQTAQMVEAYINAPERMREVAPTLFSKFDAFVRADPKLEPLSAMRRGTSVLERTTQLKLAGPQLIGKRYASEAVADVINNYISPSLYDGQTTGKIFQAYMAANNTMNHGQLAGAFHFGTTTANSFLSGGAQFMEDVVGNLRGERTLDHLVDDLRHTVLAPLDDFNMGERFHNEYMRAGSDPEMAKIVRAGELGGLRYTNDPTLMTSSLDAFKQNYYGDNLGLAALHAPLASIEVPMSLLVHGYVPRLKAGLFSVMAKRIIDMNPGRTLESLQPEFVDALNNVDSRLGQVIWNRLLMDNILKTALQATFRSPGWTGGTLLNLGLGTVDLAKFGAELARTRRVPILSKRAAYVLSVAVFGAAANAAITTVMSGTTARGLDLLFPRDGTLDDQGRPNRIVLPIDTKTAYSWWIHPTTAPFNSAAPGLSWLHEQAIGQDYYGKQIYGEDDPYWKQMVDRGKATAKFMFPFSVQGLMQNVEQGASTAKTLLPIVGIMPAGSSIKNTPAEELASRYLSEKSPIAGRTKAEFDRIQVEKQIEGAIRANRALTDKQKQIFAKMTDRQMDAIIKRAQTPWLLGRIQHLTAKQAQRVYDVGSEKEKSEILEKLVDKKMAEINPESGGEKE